MLDRVGFSVTDYRRSRASYEKALAPLGYAFLFEVPTEHTGGMGVGGFGVAPKPDFWIDGAGKPSPKLHVAFTAADRRAVDAFHRAAVAAGGRDNGKPGVRAHYHEHYYGAFVLDPDGHNIEAACQKPS